ncbi:hypothetical protein LCGC14_2582450 [marine sediment metagenome]|uniref:Uncharacterized protein n=1 Tax=marine sediment metagenome TaxID=412755 RepID=A0A0F9D6T7_9ZZZZ
MNNEVIVLLAREFGWTLDEIGKLSPRQLVDIVNELVYQRQVDGYNRSYGFAFLASVICNLVSKKRVRPEDFVGAMPQRDDDPTEEELFNLAKQTRRDNGG